MPANRPVQAPAISNGCPLLPQLHHPHPCLDLMLEALAQPEQKHQLRYHEQRPDDQPAEIIDERRLAPLVVMPRRTGSPSRSRTGRFRSPTTPACSAPRGFGPPKRIGRAAPSSAVRGPVPGADKTPPSRDPAKSTAGLIPSPATGHCGRDSNTATATTINGMPMKWLAILRGSR